MNTIEYSEGLKLLILTGTANNEKLLNSISFCKNLIKLDISNSKIITLQNQIDFKPLKQLRILYLHENHFQSLQAISPIFELSGSLNYVTLFINPITAQHSIRRQVINQCKSLWALDFNSVTDEERWKGLYYPNKNRFSSHNQASKLQWPLYNYTSLDEDQINKSLWRELEKVRVVWVHSSAILTIQRWMRGRNVRKQTNQIFQQKRKQETFIRLVVKQWKRYTQNKKELSKIMSNKCQSQFEIFRGVVQRFKQNNGLKIEQYKAFRVIQQFLRNFNKRLDNIYVVHKANKFTNLYFQKNQIGLFQLLLKRIQFKISQKQYQSKGINYELMKKSILQIQEAVQPPQVYQRQNQIYQSDVSTYRLPTSEFFYFFNCPNFISIDYMISIVTQRARISMRLKREQKWKVMDTSNPFLVKYRESIPERQSYDRPYKITYREKQKYLKTLKRLDQFASEEYKQLLMVSIPNKDLWKELLKQIWSYNASNFIRFEHDITLLEFDPQIKPKAPIFFLPYYEYDLIKSSAALKIQRVYRKFISNKNSEFDLKKIIYIIKKQKFKVYSQDLEMVQKTKVSTQEYFFQIETNDLYMPLELYLKLGDIWTHKRMRFFEQSSDILVSSNQGCFGRFNTDLFKYYNLDFQVFLFLS